MDTVGETTVEGFRARLRALEPAVAAERPDLDAARQLSDDLYHKLAAIGLFRTWLPAAYGGAELSALDFMDVVEEAAALEGAIGWLAGNGGAMSRTAAFLPEESALEIFSDPAAFVAAGSAVFGTAVPTEGGYRVTGRWPFGSGAPHATWFSPFCEIDSPDHPSKPKIMVYVPRKDVILHDNWYVSGLCGTGSGDFEFQDVFVPDRFVHPFEPEPTQPGTLYRVRTRHLFTWSVATVPLGIARGALNEFVAMATRKKRMGDSIPLAERELVHSEVGRVEANLCAARVFLRQAMVDLLTAVDAGSDAIPERVRMRLAATFASETALSAIGQLTAIAGTVSILRSFRLERYERDARAAAKHAAMSPAAYIPGGKFVLGLDVSQDRI